MSRLLATDFYYDGSSIDGSGLAPSSNSLDRLTPSTNSFVDHVWPNLEQPVGGGLPTTLDVHRWYDAHSREMHAINTMPLQF
jgi:hypothetical protein